MLTRIDLNSDLGEAETPETQAVEAAMIPRLTSVNIACGGHAGTPDTMRRTAALAAHHGVMIGAHPGLPDREGWGRVERAVTADEVCQVVADQLRVVAQVVAVEGTRLAHAKPHGALYNMAARDPRIAQAVVRGIQAFGDPLRVVALAGSALVAAAREAGLPVVQEAFVDRAYRADGRLVPRSEPGALVEGEAAVRRRIRDLLAGTVISVDGTPLPIRADSVCLHSDTPQALRLADVVRDELASAGVRIAAVSAA